MTWGIFLTSTQGRSRSRRSFYGQPLVVMSLSLVATSVLRLISPPLGALSVLVGSTYYMIRIKDVTAFFPGVDRFSIPIRYSSGAFAITQIGRSWGDYQLGLYVAFLFTIWPWIEEPWQALIARHPWRRLTLHKRPPAPRLSEEEVLKIYKSLGRVTLGEIALDILPWIGLVVSVYFLGTFQF